MDPIDYYNKYSNVYFEQTANNDMSKTLDYFLEYVPAGEAILDLGCGSGRDSKYLLEKGYDVSPLDGSKEMCLLAQINTDIEVLHMMYYDLDFDDVFGGVWACASLVHLEEEALLDVLDKIHMALITDGVFYMSVKKGNEKGIMGETYCANYQPNELKGIIKQLPGFELIDLWETNDIEANRPDQIWLNVLVKKIDIRD